MISDSEYRMIVDELRDDAAFVNALTALRTALTAALNASHPTQRRDRYADLSRHLAQVYAQLNARR
jgi:hypothetical protein